MKRYIGILLSVGLLVGLSFGYNEAVEAKSPLKAYKNCTELNKDYKGGVARTSSAKNKGGKTKYKPHVSKDLYDANKGKDRDKDSIACER